jgi:hypothetical protein
VADVPAWIDPDDLDFDQENIDHLARHGVTMKDAFEVLYNAPRFFLNQPNRTGTHVMVGPDLEGRFFLISIEPTQREGVWRPVTAWKLGRHGLRIYNKGR